MHNRRLTCNVKYRLKSKTKTTHFHWIFHFDTIAQHSYALPVFFSKLRVIVRIKCWTLLRGK